MKKTIKALLSVLVILSIVISSSSCGIIRNMQEEKFYILVSDTQELIDELADDIYNKWYGAVIGEKFGGDINKAIEDAFDDNEDEVNTIIQNTYEIEKLYKSIKKGELSEEAKAVMEAYNEYYTIVLEVSGSFNDYKEAKEPAKKELSKALKNFNSAM